MQSHKEREVMDEREIDRRSPAERPVGKNDGTQTWESLLFCHWPVDAEQLRSVVPPELEIDTFDGTAYLGVVPFKMQQIRPRWLPARFAINFLETNVRTYVVHRGRPGVYFLSLDANSRIAVWAARWGWSLPYFHSKMSMEETDLRTCYRSARSSCSNDASLEVEFSIGKELQKSQPGTLEYFLLERYLLFVQRRNRLHVGQVHHAPYQASEAQLHHWRDRLVSAAGIPEIAGSPEIAHYCQGVDVEVFSVRPCLDSNGSGRSRLPNP